MVSSSSEILLLESSSSSEPLPLSSSSSIKSLIPESLFKCVSGTWNRVTNVDAGDETS